jgi:hypothetical protein
LAQSVGFLNCRCLGVTTLPSWTNADWTSNIAEPFRSDGDFWSGLAASADALVTLGAAIAISVVLALTGQGLWSLVPFAVPAGLTIRAALISGASSRRSRESFADPKEWRDAERNAVATAFGKALSRPRGASH